MTQIEPGATCQNHPDDSAIARCGSCGRRLCDACFLRTVDATAWCEACVFDLKSAQARRWPLGLTFFVLCLIAAVTGRRYEVRISGEASLEVWATVLVAGIAGAVFFIVRGGRDHGRTIAKRPARQEQDVEFVHDEKAAHPYRARLKRIAKQIAPPLSGRGTTAVLLACMLLCAVALPVMLGLPRLLEAELVVLTWWLLWATTLSVLLHRGFRLSDDHVYRWPAFSNEPDVPASEPPQPSGAALRGKRKRGLPAPRERSDRPKSQSAKGSSGTKWSDLAGCDPGCSAAPGVWVGMAIAAVALAATFLLIELVLPALFAVAYLAVRGGIARVANDDHDCAGELGRSAAWGTLWATLYALPLAGAVWAVHALVTR